MCLAANPRLLVKRARFSALIHGDLSRAVQNLVAPDSAASAAVDARQEIDLRIGASFTRFQTLLLQVRRGPLLPCHRPVAVLSQPLLGLTGDAHCALLL